MKRRIRDPYVRCCERGENELLIFPLLDYENNENHTFAKKRKFVRIICKHFVYTMYIRDGMECVKMEWKEMDNEKEVEIMSMATTVQKWGK